MNASASALLLRRAESHCSLRISSPLPREKMPVSGSRMAWRTSATMKASWLIPARLATPAIRISSQNAPANEGQFSVAQLR